MSLSKILGYTDVESRRTLYGCVRKLMLCYLKHD